MAIAIALREKAKWPYSRFGTAHFLRGTPDNIERFGPSFREATPDQKMARQNLGYIGRGSYWGRQYGSQIGGALGDWASSRIDNMVGGLTGRGALLSTPTETNSLINPVLADVVGAPTDEVGTVVIKHTEYVGDIYSKTLFHNEGFYCNPGNPILFPWLSQLASNYTEYEFYQLVFEYKSVTSVLSDTSSQVGTVTMAFTYNAGDDLMTTKQQMLQYCGNQSVQINNNLLFGVECDPKKNAISPRLYVTNAVSGAAIPDQDLKTYFLGCLQIAVNGCQAVGKEIGELYVHYNVILRKPKLFTTIGYANPSLILSGFKHTADSNNAAQFITDDSSNISVDVSQVIPYVSNGSTFLSISGITATTYDAVWGSTNWAGLYVAEATEPPDLMSAQTEGQIFQGSSSFVATGSAYGIIYQFPANLTCGTYRMTYIYMADKNTETIKCTSTGIIRSPNITVIDACSSPWPSYSNPTMTLTVVFRILTTPDGQTTTLSNSLGRGYSFIGFGFYLANISSDTSTQNSLVIEMVNPNETGYVNV